MRVLSNTQTEDRNFHPHYRPDIDGLRAVAILSVVIFHAFPARLQGGFVGVDIFFVISGYLISTIIFRSLDRGDLSFYDFYANRAKRIFPALIIVLIVCYVFGWYVLLTDEFLQLGKHIAGGAGFVQNFVLWCEAGYFDKAAETKILQHLWSLAIEEQYYLLFPVFIYLVWRQGLNVLAIVSIFFLLSFTLNVLQAEKHPISTFFLPQSRFWELLAGSILAYFQFFKKAQLVSVLKRWVFHPVLFRQPLQPNQRIFILNNFIAATGLVLVVIAVFGINKEKAFPGWWALIPVAGSFLIILAGPQAWVNRTILASKSMVFVGIISYPLYLWHWPVLVFARIVSSDLPSHEVRFAAIALSLCLAWLTYKLIEQPIRFWAKRSSVVPALTLVLIAVGINGYSLSQGDGFSDRRVVAINRLANSGAADKNERSRISVKSGCGLNSDIEKLIATCIHDPRGKAKFALIGDSKSGVLWPGVFGEASQNGYWVFIGGTGPNGSNVPVISDAPQYSAYQKLIRPTIASLALNKDIEVVVFSTATRMLFLLENIYSIDDLPASKNFDIAFAGLDQAAGDLIRSGKKVVITIDNPTLKDPKQCISRITAVPLLNQLLTVNPIPGCSISYDHHLELSKQYRQLLEKLKVKYPNDIYIFDSLDLLCDMDNRICSSSSEGRSLYSYSDHISQHASFRIAKKLVPFVESLRKL